MTTDTKRSICSRTIKRVLVRKVYTSSGEYGLSVIDRLDNRFSIAPFSEEVHSTEFMDSEVALISPFFLDLFNGSSKGNITTLMGNRQVLTSAEDAEAVLVCLTGEDAGKQIILNR